MLRTHPDTPATLPVTGLQSSRHGFFRAHQCELIPVQLPGPEGFGAVAFHQGLLAPDLVLRLPGGETLQAEETEQT